jgi:flagellar basal-body rod protein FlgB
MFAQLTSGLDIHAKALVLRAERQRVIASNIANADTPGYAARDINFKETLTKMTGASSSEMSRLNLGMTPVASQSAAHLNHIALTGSSQSQLSNSDGMTYATQTQPSVDSNSVDLDRERASFVDNSVRYESTLRFINGQSKTILSAIQGQ